MKGRPMVSDDVRRSVTLDQRTAAEIAAEYDVAPKTVERWRHEARQRGLVPGSSVPSSKYQWVDVTIGWQCPLCGALVQQDAAASFWILRGSSKRQVNLHRVARVGSWAHDCDTPRA